ncbi:unnamed protein product [Trifolium pratense]|uniref:Uncharacterized protein n=1 Tax=Trifolium pratense TaxID=57577 RepID=A0ACB0IZY7_TRIPR|nr:unnamed protein product [Trifolium pratense]
MFEAFLVEKQEQQQEEEEEKQLEIEGVSSKSNLLTKKRKIIIRDYKGIRSNSVEACFRIFDSVASSMFDSWRILRTVSSTFALVRASSIFTQSSVTGSKRVLGISLSEIERGEEHNEGLRTNEHNEGRRTNE